MAPSEAGMVGTGLLRFPPMWLAIPYLWSHSIDRFTNEIYGFSDWEQGFIDFAQRFGAAINGIESSIATLFTAATNWTQPRYDPLTLDLDGDGLETLGISATAPILFDHDGDGVKTSTGWVKPDDGFLVLDRNGNGVIDSGRELFGDSTPLSTGGNAADGFAALAQEDTNLDGKVDAADTRFANLRIWRDLNQDGISQAGELTTLAANNIASLTVAKTENFTLLGNGNVIADLGAYTKTDGTTATLGETAQLGDIDLAENTFISQFTDSVPLTAEAQALPDMQGSGQVRDLREATSLSAALTTALSAYAAAPSRDAQTAQLDALVKAWSDTSTMATTATGAYAGHALTISFAGMVSGSPEHQAWLDRLTVLERFNGRTFQTVPTGTAPVSLNFSNGQMALLNQSYAALTESVYGGLVMETRLKPYLDSITLNLDANGLGFDFAGLDGAIASKAQADAFNAVADLIDMQRYGGQMLSGLGWTPYASLAHVLDSTTLTPEIEALLATEHITYIGATATSHSVATTQSTIVLGNGLANTLIGNSGSDQLYGLGGNDTLNGGNGDDTLAGGAGDDALYGGWGDDRLEGGAGADILGGGVGNDTYVFNLGDGVDTINETNDDYFYHDISGNSTSMIDVLEFGGDINPGDIAVVRNDVDLELRHANNADKIIFANWFASGGDDYQIDRVNFANGAQWTQAQLTAWGLIVEGTSGNDRLEGADISYYGDTLKGLAGNDILYGGGGHDRLEGGAGSDFLNGGNGNDTYVFNLGDGVDGVYEMNGTTSTDVLKLGTGINPADITVARNGVDLELRHANSTDKITLANWYVHDDYQIDRVYFTDGSQWTKEYLTGRAAMVGTAGNDTLDGRYGTEAMAGGAGNDTYWIDEVGDAVTELANEGIDLVNSSITYTLGANVENLTLTGTAVIDGTGNALDNILAGNSVANTLAGGLGNDTYVVGNGDTVVEGLNEGTDKVQSGITYTLGANVENLTLIGTAAINGAGNTLNNILTGNSGNNTLDGGAGADTLIGGLGNDIYVVDTTGDVVTENASAGADTVQSTVTYTLGANVENLALTGTAALNGVGNALNNILTGNSGNNTLDGEAGADTLVGGLGNDTFIVDNAGDVVTENGGAGTDTVQSSVTYTLVANVENLTLTGSVAINGTGNTLNNTLIGNGGSNTLMGLAGDDSLDGGAGADSMTGGAGNDIYVVDNASDVVTENANEGTDTVQSSIAYALGANVENLTLAGSNAINGTGNELNNALTGNTGANALIGGAGNDSLNGGAGADSLIGGIGNDTYVVDNAGDVVTENANEGMDTVQSAIMWTLGANLENLTLTGTAAIDGSGNELANTLIGNAAANTLTGLAGNDSLNGGAGADSLIGGLGNDTYTVDNLGDVVTENANEGTDTVQSSITCTLAANVENLTLTGTAAINGTGNTLDNVLTGNTGANTLTGGAGNDTLNGGAGVDTLIGGIGNDTYVVENSGDVVMEAANEGTDLVQSSVTYTLGANVENLTLTGTGNINGTGNSLSNTLTGNAAANTLKGGAGYDILDGGAGADRMEGGTEDDGYYVDNAGDVVVENAGEGDWDWIETTLNNYVLASNVETLGLAWGAGNLNGTGNAANNWLGGNEGNNVLTALGGNDELDGGDGQDTLIGGAGDDVYYLSAYDGLIDSVVENTGEGVDTVYFYNPTAGATYALAANVENATTEWGYGLNLTGNELANTLTGDYGDNVLDGGAGADTLRGGYGNDTYLVDNTGDVVTENLNEGTDSVNSAVAWTLGANVENLSLTGSLALTGTGNELANTLLGNTADNILNGGAGSDTLFGGAGNDLLDGGSGTDDLSGGTGNDTYVLDDINDLVTESLGEGTDTVLLNTGYHWLTDNVENLTLGIAGWLGGGNDLGNVLTGNEQVNILFGQGGNDTLIGLGGNDWLDGGTGTDALIGGAGNDTDMVDSTTDVVTELLNDGTETVNSSVAWTLGANLENLNLTGDAAINGSGNELANSLTGNAANNALNGGAGNDILKGNAGGMPASSTINSLVIYAKGTPVEGGYPIMQVYVEGVLIRTFTVDAASYTAYSLDPAKLGMAAGKIDVVFSNDAYSAALGQDRNLYVQKIVVNGQTMNATDNGVFYDVGTGAGAFDGLNLRLGTETISSNGALRFTLSDNDTLDGGAGADQMAGGIGNDTYVVDNAGDTVTEALNEGLDSVRSGISHTLGANVENLVLTGTAYINGTGNALNNLLMGNAANNTLAGGDGADTLQGYNGNDRLDGGAGNDILQGGQGSDIYVVDSTGDSIWENTNEGWDTVETGLSHTLGSNIENLTLTGTAAVNGTGNSLSNTLTGNAAANTLKGGAGYDTLDGGAGADRMEGGTEDDGYYVDNAGDVVVENAGEGDWDWIETTLNNYVLSDNVETLSLAWGAGNLNGTGNAANNYLGGNEGNNVLTALGGNDELDGGDGLDTLIGGAGDDVYYLSAYDGLIDSVVENANEGMDTVYFYNPTAGATYALAANVENATSSGYGLNLTGNGLGNALTGDYGNNVLDGGAGADTLAGGYGDDTYGVDNAGDVVTENLDEGTDTVQSSVDWSLGANVENLTLTGHEYIAGTGNDLANVLEGNDVDNTLFGLAGNDTLKGGAGYDYLDGGAGADRMEGGTEDDGYYVDDMGDVVVENAGEGDWDWIETTLNNYVLSDNVEALGLAWGAGNLTGTGNAANNWLYGNDGSNVLTGLDGNDELDGSTGADTLIGGKGDDSYVVDNAGDVVTELAGEGTDKIIVQTLATYTLGATIENGERWSTGTLYGNALNNVLTGSYANDALVGGAGNDTLNGSYGYDWMVGGAGADQLNGGDGGDWAVYGGSSQAVSIDLALNTAHGGEAEGDTFSGMEHLFGSNYNDTLVGDATNNTLQGSKGNDLLDGGAGTDTAAYYSDTGGVLVDLAAGTATDGYGGTDTLLNFENIAGSNVGNDLLYGNAANNSLSGGGGNDALQGRAGNDYLDGGAGNDTYQFNRGDGSDSWTDNDATLGNTDVARFGADIAHDQIWFRKVGNDLETQVIGTTDKTLVKNWYTGSNYHLERFESGNGKVLLDSQIDALVQAMAAFTPPAAGQTTLPTTYQDTLAPVLAANWQ
ncbi:MAG: calcium-binding protein [Pseudomonadota bacterium]|nr:calcium-binding protein [Pseudomonadota bacterium]